MSGDTHAVGIEKIKLGEKRVDISDKMIINATCDVNQLFALKCKWAWEKYKQGCANHWMPDEICMAVDIKLYSEMIDLKNEKIFFETRVIEYKSGG